MQRLRNVLALALTLAMVAGCGRARPGDDAPSAKQLRVAVIPKGTSHDFWYSVRFGAEKADAELPDLEITWKGPTSEGDTNDQIQIFDSFVVDGYDGICLAPLDAVALGKPVERAISQNVPVVIFDSALGDSNGIISYVATNNYRGGSVAGEHLAKLLEGQGEVLLMRYAINSQSTEEREQGFLDALAHYPGITLVSKDKHAGPDEQGAIAMAEQLLTNHAGHVDGIFCPNQSTTSGMLTVLRRMGLAGKVKFVGFDAGENIAQGIEKNEIQGTVLQDPVQMGYDAVMTMYQHLSGKQAPNRIEIPETLATPENREDPQVRALLHPQAAQ